MALPQLLNQRELEKFREDSNNNTAIAVVAPDGTNIGTKSVYNASAPTLTDGDEVFPQVDQNGNAYVNDVSIMEATVDSVSSKLATDVLMNDLVELTPQFAAITASSSGATEVITAVTSKKIRVLGYVITANAAVNVKFQSDGTPTDLTGLLYCGDKGGASVPFNPLGWFETIAGEALDINLSDAVAVGGHLVYVEV